MGDIDFKNVIEIKIINEIIDGSNHPIKKDLIDFMNALGELINIKRLAGENVNESVSSDEAFSTDEEWSEGEH